MSVSVAQLAHIQQPQSQSKVRKGWLSRWTRKQWIRHWFVLKNGSLTYYRGPAAELCNFLDGVLDLSLIKDIEIVHATGSNATKLNHHSASTVKGLSFTSGIYQQSGQTSPNGGMQQQNTFTFSLKMWNGESHLLAAASSDERQSWLDAIRTDRTGGAGSGDDESGTISGESNECLATGEDEDSSCSSSSSSRSNLSSRSDLDRLFSNATFRRNQPNGGSLNAKLIRADLLRSSQQLERSQTNLFHPTLHKSSCTNKFETNQVIDKTLDGSSINESQDQNSALPKHENLIDDKSDRRDELEKRPPSKRRLLYHSVSSGDEDDGNGEQEDQEEEQARPIDVSTNSIGDIQITHSHLQTALLTNCNPLGRMQKKRVTFDLSLQQIDSSSTEESCSSTGEDEEEDEERRNGDEEEQEDEDEEEDEGEQDDEEQNSESEEDADSDLSILSSGSSDLSDRMETNCPEISDSSEAKCKIASDTQRMDDQDENADLTCELVRRLIEERKLRLKARGAPNRESCDTSDHPSDIRPQTETSIVVQANGMDPSSTSKLLEKPMETNDGTSQGHEKLISELRREAELAKSSVGSLERKLLESESSRRELEISCQRWHAETLRLGERHQSELARLEGQVFELRGELEASQVKLAETEEKLFQYECKLDEKHMENSERDEAASSRSSNQRSRGLTNWLISRQKHYESPIVFVSNSKQMALRFAATHQQQLESKLLSQGKQIQRKLNELELKVDSIRLNPNVFPQTK